MAKNVSPINYASGLFTPIIEKCEGCERVVTTEQAKYCTAYTDPAAKWKLGICNFATHQKPETLVVKIKVNPLKASKRAMAGK
ncbi:MAG: hypothetical protein COZ12_07265 [Deltaproteobacteria bacterium CG_4_10_14_3_um_filter_60_8]|nr:MAG: hypothetical protein AUK28_09165 [Desulfobacterales bacterium CG2_30_60_27]PIY20964.1 MAG: hypothetical protein COZ12_07265 [Deltaproteobacteria bacterium CG_4_10_14_3_um_filter_60_8]